MLVSAVVGTGNIILLLITEPRISNSPDCAVRESRISSEKASGLVDELCGFTLQENHKIFLIITRKMRCTYYL